MVMLTESLQRVFVWPSENWKSGASGRKKKSKKEKTGIAKPVQTMG